MPLALDPILLEVLACPDTHHAPLRVGTDADPDAELLSCTECGRRFPVRDGIPVLLLEEASDGVADGAVVKTAVEKTAVEHIERTPDDGRQEQE